MVGVVDRTYGGRAMVHLSVSQHTYDPVVVVAHVMTLWAVRGVGEVVPDTAEDVVEDVQGEQVEDREQG